MLVRNSSCANFVEGDYFQEFIKGKVISIQFFVKKGRNFIYSICSQWNYKNKELPFLIGGMISIKPSSELSKKIALIIHKISNSYKLNGLNSIDLIIPENKKNSLKLIDINARPGLSINLLSKIYKEKLFDGTSFKKTNKIFATAIVYCSKPLKINDSIISKLKKIKREYDITEIPYKKNSFKKNDPFCLVHTESKSTKETKNKIKEISNKVIRLIHK